MFQKNLDTIVIGVLFVVLAKVFDRIHFWQLLGLESPHGFIFIGLMFLVLVGLLRHTLFDPYLNIIDERQTQITHKKKQAEDDKIKAHDMLQSYEQRILSAKMEAIKLRERITIEAETEEKKALDTAKQKAQQDLDRAVLQIKNEAEKVRNDLIQSTDALVQQLVEEVLSPKSGNLSTGAKNMETTV